ncbi:MAG: glycosyltransferase, partial [Flammeovirgaceae bacterium]|nr:glycosyltransferase [Flammeovirgaceae bacterium]MDW8286463.1 glycosyltransferase [Flammeovirgaceae bacterium]
PLLEIIVVDDASQDNSVEQIRHFLTEHAEVDICFIQLSENVGNCQAFNIGLKRAQGKYVVDFAADDVMMPERIATQVAFFEQLPEKYGVIFSDVLEIDECSRPIKTYYRRNASGKLLQPPPQGFVYEHLLRRAFISPPSMMYRRSMLEELGGYDESLSYEDYDLWVRSGKKYYYGFQDAILTQRRILSSSHSQGFYAKKQNKHLASTLKVCEKAFLQNEKDSEHRALAVSVRYHWRLAIFTENFTIAEEFYKLLCRIDHPTWKDHFFYSCMRLRLPLFEVYRFWQKLRRKMNV